MDDLSARNFKAIQDKLNNLVEQVYNIEEKYRKSNNTIQMQEQVIQKLQQEVMILKVSITGSGATVR